MPGSGKTVLGLSFVKHLRQRGNPALSIDGDVFRRFFPKPVGYSWEDREALTASYVAMAGVVASQGLHAVVSTVSAHSWVPEALESLGARYVVIRLEVSEKLRNAERQQVYRELLAEPSIRTDGFPSRANLVLRADEPADREHWLANLIEFATRENLIDES